jgi:class 3 adenylate cyclase
MSGSAMYVISEQAEAYLEAIARFVREVRDEEAAFESILATVLFTDIVGSTARQAELGDVRWHELISEHHHRIRGCLARYRGRELDAAGDGFFAAFDGVALRASHRRVPEDRRESRRARGLDRRQGDVARGAVGRSSRRPCATSWPARASRSPNAASTS